MNPFKKSRIDYLFFLSFSVFIFIALFMIVQISYRFSADQLVRTVSFQQQRLLSATNEEVHIQMKTIEQLSLITVNNIPLDFVLQEQPDNYDRFLGNRLLTDYLVNIVNGTGFVHGMDLYVDKELFSNQVSIRYADLTSLKHQEWYSEIAKADYAWIGERYEQASYQQQKVVSFVRKITMPQGRMLGVLVIHLKSSAIRDILRNGGPTAERYLFDSGDRMLVQTIDGSFNIAGIESNMTGASGYTRLKREDALLVWSRHPKSDWMIVELTPWENVVSGSTQLLHILLIVGSLAILVGIAATMFISRQFIKPVSLLLKAMVSYQPRRQRVMLPTDYQNEFGRLFREFSVMADRIEQLYDTVELESRKKMEAEIKALQTMINPHFIYNTLDQVNWMAIKVGHEQISEVLEMTGKMLRIVLSKGESFIPLHEELAIVQCYIAIQMIKWEGHCQYIEHVAPDLMDIRIPKITLLPFIENAFIHGFHGQKTGTLELRIEQDEEFMKVWIRDDGNGIDPNWESKPERRNGSFGLKNVKERISHYYGNLGTFHLRRRSNGGTEVLIALPISNNMRDSKEVIDHVENRSSG